MLFKGEDSSLRLEIVGYEFPAGGGEPDSDDRNWLVLRCTWVREDGGIVRDTNSCLLTYELRELTAGLKVLNAGIRDAYASGFADPYFELAVQTEGDCFLADVSFYLPNTMDGDDTAQVEARLTKEEMQSLIRELDTLCGKFPDRS